MKCNCGGPAYVKAKEKQDSASVTMCRACWMAWSFGRTIHSALFVTGIAELPVCDCANIFATTPKEKQVNLEVDVMEGDGFWRNLSGLILQRRGKEWKWVGFRRSGEFTEFKCEPDVDAQLDLPTFTKYCEGCGLTVKMVKPEPQVETIKPPEWGVVFESGHVAMYESKECAGYRVRDQPNSRVVRIDWGRA